MIEQFIESIEKSKWGPGPWHDEPDFFIFYHYYKCVGVRHDALGHWCGYTGVPKEHPLHGKSYDHRLPIDDVGADVNTTASIPLLLELAGGHGDGCVSMELSPPVHGGLTYAGDLSHSPLVGEGLWYFGFDMGHAGDLMPGHLALMREMGHPARWHEGEYGQMSYVEQECRKLADWLYTRYKMSQ